MKKSIDALPLRNVVVDDPFWKRYVELVRGTVLPYQWDILNDRVEGAGPSCCIRNFRIAAGEIRGSFGGMVFQDSDVYKWIEAVAYSLCMCPDAKLEALADGAIDIICAAQQPDGYLNTYYIINGLEKRFTFLRDHHELYCLGHLIEAAVAYYRSTGKRKLLDAAIRFADCVCGIFGTGENQIPGYPGHEIIELALVKLYRLTGDKKYLRLAVFFIDRRGQEPLYFREETERYNRDFYWHDTYFRYQYYQAGKPVRAQTAAEGHAVRAVYLYSGMADVAAETNDEELLEVCCRLWDNITGKQMYITGAIGVGAHGESFTFDYDLPNDTVYGETCASIGLVFFAIRLFELTGDSKYTDVIERALYNGIISGISLNGTEFFYVNPLEADPEACEKDYGKRHVRPERQKWFDCACCPPNFARLVSSVGNYAYSQSADIFFVNLYIGGKIQADIDGAAVIFHVQTEYPWKDKVRISVEAKAPVGFSLAVRIPGWCEKHCLKLNGTAARYRIHRGYAYVSRVWESRDTVELTLDMPVAIVGADPRVKENVGKAAVMRGPIVYCLEQTDNGTGLHRYFIDSRTAFDSSFEPGFLGGTVVLRCRAKYLSGGGWEDGQLYRPGRSPEFEERTATWIPYYAWANRGPGEMLVWVHCRL